MDNVVRKVVISSIVLYMVVMFSSPYAEATITCTQVTEDVAGCVQYILEKEATKPPRNCCSGIRALNSSASTTGDRRTACQCLQNLARNLPNKPDNDKVSSLPTKCGVKMAYKISLTTKCHEIP